MNADLARRVLDALRAAGVEELCICPAGRNAPWVELVSADPGLFHVTWHYEERSAAFFALGRIRATGKPVAIVTTSGTAVGELLPAAMEAYFSGLPLMLLTADRPRRFRGSGAPQAALQVGLFGPYAPTAFDLEEPGVGDPAILGREATDIDSGPTGPRRRSSEGERLELDGWNREAPVHINVCFEEPHGSPARDGREAAAKEKGGLSWEHGAPGLRTAPGVSRLDQFLAAVANPFVVVGALEPDEREDVLDVLRTFPGEIYCESLSGLRESPELASQLTRVADGVFARSEAAGTPFDAVLRLGGVPTHRLWRDLEDRYAHLPVLSISRLPFSGLGRESELVGGFTDRPGATRLSPSPPRMLDSVLREVPLPEGEGVSGSPSPCPLPHALHDEGGRLEALLAGHPDSEPGLVRRLSERIEAGSHVFLGNSLPIREWDLAATFEPRGFECRASRGLNGIDGQVSTFLGLCSPGRPNWALLGDLTTLYDLGGLWPAAQLDPETGATIVVMNNGGGRIFDRMFTPRQFQNEHDVSFELWAAMWGLPYLHLADPAAIPSSERGLRIIELTPDGDATRAFWKTFDEAFK